jgi:hypothetical protein
MHERMRRAFNFQKIKENQKLIQCMHFPFTFA